MILTQEQIRDAFNMWVRELQDMRIEARKCESAIDKLVEARGKESYGTERYTKIDSKIKEVFKYWDYVIERIDECHRRLANFV